MSLPGFAVLRDTGRGDGYAGHPTVAVRSDRMTDPLTPAWPAPSPKDLTADDLDRVPGLPAHTEPIDGTLVRPGLRTDFHTAALYLPEAGTRRTAPPGFRVRRGDERGAGGHGSGPSPASP
jgi:hypothetical protein